MWELTPNDDEDLLGSVLEIRLGDPELPKTPSDERAMGLDEAAYLRQLCTHRD